MAELPYDVVQGLSCSNDPFSGKKVDVQVRPIHDFSSHYFSVTLH
jgi:hypothetical protein